jgi:type II secretory pathway pseudopilin PulG
MNDPQKNRTFTIGVIFLAVLAGMTFFCCGGVAVLLPPAIQAAREAARRQQARDNLRQIGEALRNYQDRHRSDKSSAAVEGKTVTPNGGEGSSVDGSEASGVVPPTK